MQGSAEPRAPVPTPQSPGVGGRPRVQVRDARHLDRNRLDSLSEATLHVGGELAQHLLAQQRVAAPPPRALAHCRPELRCAIQHSPPSAADAQSAHEVVQIEVRGDREEYVIADDSSYIT
jgi:hypothetical protein